MSPSLSRRMKPLFTTTQFLWNRHPPTTRLSAAATTTRLLGTKNSQGNPPGDILIENAQEALQVDLDRLRNTLEQIRLYLGYPTYDVNLYLIDDEFMQETNRNTRGINKPTDILSFPSLDYETPGTLMDPDFDIPDLYCLGEMLIDVPYVIRGCQDDKANAEVGDDGDEEEEEEEERGVSGAMAKIYNPEDRINMLLVHGMLHLVGHDHEEDDEYELMVSMEEEILKELGMMPKNKS